MGENTKHWRINPEVRLYWRARGEDHVLFDAASGQTHVLNELGRTILSLFTTQTLSNTEVSEQLATYYKIVPDAELQAAVDQMLIDLEVLGLIDPYTV